MKRIKILILILLCFVISICFGDLLRVKDSQAYELDLPAPTELLELSYNDQSFNTALLRAVEFDDLDSAKLKFYFDLPRNQKHDEKDFYRQISYFYAALMMPSDSLWVNLAPFEQNRIINPALEETALGYELLSQDYMLKQLSASLTNPKSKLGKLYWEQKQNDELEISSFDKVWLSPGNLDVIDNGNTILIESAHLKAQTETDYLSDQFAGLNKNETKLSILLATIEKEVNYGANFKRLRQVYYACVLAQYFKDHLKNTFYAKHSNSSQTSGIADPQHYIKDTVFKLYNKSFEKGVYKYSLNLNTDQSKAKKTYISGGLNLGLTDSKQSSSVLNDKEEHFEGDIVEVAVNSQELLDEEEQRSKLKKLSPERQAKRDKFIEILSTIDLYEKANDNNKGKNFKSFLSMFESVEHIVAFMGDYGFAHTNFVVTKQDGKIVIKEEYATHTNVFGIDDENAVDIKGDQHAAGGLAKVYKYASTVERRVQKKGKDNRQVPRRKNKQDRRQNKTKTKVEIDRRVSFEDKRKNKDKRQRDRRLDNKGQERVLRIVNTDGLGTRLGYEKFLRYFLADVKTKILHDSFPKTLDGFVNVDAIGIARVDESLQEELGAKYVFMTDMNYGGVDLNEYLVEQDHISAKEMKDIFMPVMKLLSHMHSRNIPHADIKPQNILRSLLGRGKLIDFGGAHKGGIVLDEAPVTLDVLAPELANNYRYDSPNARQTTAGDVYALGCTLYVMLTGEGYNPRPARFDVIKFLEARARQNSDYFDSKVSKFWKKHKVPKLYRPLLRAMLDVNPKKRISIDKAIKMFESIVNMEMLANSRDLSIGRYKKIIKKSLKEKEKAISKREKAINAHKKDLKRRQKRYLKEESSELVKQTLENISNEFGSLTQKSADNFIALESIKFAKAFKKITSYAELIELNSQLHEDELIDYSSSSVKSVDSKFYGGIDLNLSTIKKLQNAKIADQPANIYQLSFNIENINYKQ